MPAPFFWNNLPFPVSACSVHFLVLAKAAQLCIHLGDVSVVSSVNMSECCSAMCKLL